MRGKVQLSWSRGSKSVVLEEGVVCLPDILVSTFSPESAHDDACPCSTCELTAQSCCVSAAGCVGGGFAPRRYETSHQTSSECAVLLPYWWIRLTCYLVPSMMHATTIHHVAFCKQRRHLNTSAHACMQVAESISENMACWIRFVGINSTAPAVELAIQIRPVAANPVAWGMAIVAGNSQPTPRDQGEVQCGQPFTLEVCAHDKFGHRCPC